MSTDDNDINGTSSDDNEPISDDNVANIDIQAWCSKRVSEDINDLGNFKKAMGASKDSVDYLSGMEHDYAVNIISKLKSPNASTMDMRVLISTASNNSTILSENAERLVRRLKDSLADLKDASGSLFASSMVSVVNAAAGTVHNNDGNAHNDGGNADSNDEQRRMMLVDAALSDATSELHNMLHETINRASRESLSCGAYQDAIRAVMKHANDYYLAIIDYWNHMLTELTGKRTPSASVVYELQIEPMTSTIATMLSESNQLESERRQYMILLMISEQNARMRHLLRMAPVAYPGRIDDETVDSIITGGVEPGTITSVIAPADNEPSDSDNHDDCNAAPGAGITLDAIRMLGSEDTRGMEESRLKITEGWRGLAGSSQLPPGSLSDETWLRWSVDGFTEGTVAMRAHDVLTRALTALTGISAKSTEDGE